MKKIFVVVIAAGAAGCSSMIPPEVQTEFSKTLTPECMQLFADIRYQKRTKDILTPNPVFAISVGKNKNKSAMVCGMSAANASSNFNRSQALLTCEQVRETYMLDNPKSVMEPCEVFAEGYRIIYKTNEAAELRDSMKTLASPQSQ